MPPYISDLITDSELEVEICADHTIQTVYTSNPTLGARRTQEQEKWQRDKKLGQGGFGIVWLEKCTAGPSSGKLRAVKELYKGTNNVAAPKYHKELEAIAKFSQEKYRDYFVRSFGWYENTSAVYIVMEYFPNGDLEQYLADFLSHTDARQIIQQLLEGLYAMHKNNFGHRDLKPSNVLVLHKGPNWWVKIADFGISKRMDGTALRTVIGTESYLAPEVQGFYDADFTEEDEATFSLAIDIWAIGAIAFRMITGGLPFPTKRKLADYTLHGKSFPIDESLSLECAKFVADTMAASPRRRPTAKQALSYTWIASPGSFPGNVNPSQTERSSSDDLVTTSPPALASARWTTLGEDLATLHVQEPVLPTNTKSDSDARSATSQSNNPLVLQNQQTLNLTDRWYKDLSTALSPDGRLLAVKVWSASTIDLQVFKLDKKGRMQKLVTSEVSHLVKMPLDLRDAWVAFSPSGRQLAMVHETNRVLTVYILEIDSHGRMTLKQNLKLGEDNIMIEKFFSRYVYLPRSASGRDAQINFWGFNTRGELEATRHLNASELIQLFDNYTSLGRIYAFSPDGSRIALLHWTKSSGSLLRIWEVGTKGKLKQVDELPLEDNISEMRFSFDGRRLAGAFTEGARRSPGTEAAFKLSFLILQADEEGKFHQVQRYDYPSNIKIHSLALSNDGRQLALGESIEFTKSEVKGFISIWQMDGSGQLRERAQVEIDLATEFDLIFSADGRRLVSSVYGYGKPGKIYIWEVGNIR